MGKQNNIPALRFPGFLAEWRKEKLKQAILALDSGVSVNSLDEPAIKDGDVGILKTSCVSAGRFIPDENKTILQDEIKRAKLNPKKGAILISRMNTPQLVGESGYIEEDYHNLFVPDRLWMATIDEKNFVPRFVGFYLTVSRTRSYISNIATGTSGTMKNIAQPNFLDLGIAKPTLSEQIKIASFLTAIDDRLQALKKKKALLEQYKKGIMQKIFSQELRFKDNNGEEFPDWEEKSLGDVAKVIMGQSPESSSYNSDKNGMPLIQGNADIQNRISAPRNWTTETTKECQIGDLILTVRAPVGAVAKSVHNACIGRGVCAIRNNDISNIEFIYQFLLDYEPQWVRLEQGSTFTAVSGVDIKSIDFLCPCVAEQTKIANFLSAIDDKINHCQTQIKKTDQFKKGLLQQMFC